MKQELDSGEILGFGQELGEIEARYFCLVEDEPLRHAGTRQGLDQFIKLKNVKLTFDTGRLTTFEFKYPYKFRHEPAPFAEGWKNFSPIEGLRIHGEMDRQVFLEYFEAWKLRAKWMGAKKGDHFELKSNRYSVTRKKNQDTDMIQIDMGPSRPTREGRYCYCDGWTLHFALEEKFPLAKGMLTSLTAYCDEFSTRARWV